MQRSYLFLHIWRSEPSCRHKQQQHQPVPTTGIMYALINIPIWSSNLFGLSGEQQFQRKNHEEWLVDKARKLSQIIQSLPLFFLLIFSNAWKHKHTPYMHTSLSIPTSSNDNLRLIKENPYFLACLCLCKGSVIRELKAELWRKKPKTSPVTSICLDQPLSLNDWQAHMNCQIQQPNHTPS